MLKMALFDCVISEKCCSVDGGRGICPLFSSPPRGVWQLKSPHPREFAIQGKKDANARGSAQGGAGRRWNWLMHKSRKKIVFDNWQLHLKEKEIENYSPIDVSVFVFLRILFAKQLCFLETWFKEFQSLLLEWT